MRGDGKLKVSCIQCGKEVEIYPYRKNRFRFCSYTCNLNDKHARFQDKMNAESSKRFKGNKLRKGLKPWNKGIPNLAITGSKNPSWKGGIYPESKRLRNTIAYREWRDAVLKRDNSTCVLCGFRSQEQGDICTDHIKPFSAFPELRLVISNGRTLCRPCDLKYSWHGNNYNTRKVTKKD